MNGRAVNPKAKLHRRGINRARPESHNGWGGRGHTCQTLVVNTNPACEGQIKPCDSLRLKSKFQSSFLKAHSS